MSNIRSKIQAAKESTELELKKEAPALYWALKYHINSRGERMAFNKVPYLLSLYVAIKNDHNQVVEKSVQCGLSELYIIQSHLEAANGLTVMYVLPKYELRNRFVNNRIYKLHRKSAKYAELIRSNSSSGIHRTSMIHFGKGTLIYVGSNVESEFIEVPIDSAFIDEKDRCNLSNLELLPDRYSASPYRFQREISNPTVEGFGIDERFLKSSQGLWNIKCPHCGKWFVPDFFNNVVKQIGPRQYVPRDTSVDLENELQEIRLICECGKPVDRFLDGEYVHKYQNKEYRGYRISKIFNKFVSLRKMYDKWVDAQGNEIKTQVFYNSDLGLPYTSKGAKITREDLNRLKKNYEINFEQYTHPRILGVDIGSDLNYVLRELVKIDGVIYLRLLKVGTVPTFELLCSEIIDQYRPKAIVVDANPEIHKVQDLKSAYSNVYSSKFQEGKLTIDINKTDRIVNMDRTALLDSVKANVDKELYINPVDAEFLDNGDYYAQLCASTRILEVDDEKPDKARFVWVHTQPDHYFLAEGYCLQALSLVPNIDSIIDFFKKNTSKLAPEIAGIQGVTGDEAKELSRLIHLSPEQALENIRKMNMKGKK